MKHKKKKSHKQDLNQDTKSKHHKKKKKRSKKLSGEKFKSENKVRLKRLTEIAMASGFQNVRESPGSSTQSIDTEDDIQVVYDKRNDLGSRKGPEKKQESKFCLTKPFDVQPQDIPLPPENWVSHSKKLNHSIKLEDIPLPPSPNTYERLMKEKECGGAREAQLREILASLRNWEYTDIGRKLQDPVYRSQNPLSQSHTFTLMSYNVLAQRLLEDHQYLYRNHDHRALNWKERSKTLWKEILEADADILCLQEVQASHIETFYDKLKDLGYDGIFKRRSIDHIDGCAIYYKTEKFKLIGSTNVEYLQNNVSPTCILDRSNVAIIAHLSLNGSSDHEDQIVVATTHLLYNPRRHDVKLAQTQVLLAELDRVSYIGVDRMTGRPLYLPTIITGDFNLRPGTAVYKLLVEGRLSFSKLAARSLEPSYGHQARQDTLLPFELQISHSCQHLGMLLNRFETENGRTRNENLHFSKLSKLYNSDIYTSIEQYLDKHSNIPLLYEEDFCGRVDKGALSHRLNLQSVYKHIKVLPPSGYHSKRYHDVCEATTFQDEWVTVDYIFYSGIWNEKHRCAEEGRLKLLSRYTLPTSTECKKLKSIPNFVCGSDHLSLIARFFLDRK